MDAKVISLDEFVAQRLAKAKEKALQKLTSLEPKSIEEAIKHLARMQDLTYELFDTQRRIIEYQHTALVARTRKAQRALLAHPDFTALQARFVMIKAEITEEASSFLS